MHEELESWHEEKQSAFLYRVLSQRESGRELKTLFSRLAEAAETQARYWEKLALGKGAKLPPRFEPSLRARLVSHMIRRLGPRRMLPVLAAMKVRGLSVYTQGMPTGHAAPVAGQAEFRHRRMSGSGGFRASVFGVNDGLVSNASLILGMSGAAFDTRVVLLAGVAGLLAGAASMAAGEYVSMRSQREMFEYQIGLEAQELDTYPEEEAEELALIYEARGIAAVDAKKLADTIISDPTRALDTLTREELGLNPHDLGSAWLAAISSFIAFAVGAAIPLLPFLWRHATHSLDWTIGLTLLALFGTGAASSLFTGKSVWWSGLRMAGIGVLAAGTTYLVGRLFGVALS
ncbi:MAG TPA: VIT1/CCC1 transporter family protein [Gammaproteobacteria bacterium]|nr:VIT1/CCC1 transporter family protein [Gammaproteobacteria bacterium]